MSNSALVSGLVLLSTFLFDVTNLASMALDLGFSLPNSRVQEVCFLQCCSRVAYLLCLLQAEADEMGLSMQITLLWRPMADLSVMMANACFRPEAAIKLYVGFSEIRISTNCARWSRMEKIEKVRIPQFMSTHPTVCIPPLVMSIRC